MLSNLLPDDTVVDILSRLPVSSLSRFRCVCKPWHNLFNNPSFRKMNLDHSVKNEKVHLMIMRGNHIYSSVGYYDLSSSVTCYAQTVEIDYPFSSPLIQSPWYPVHIRGSFNGLLLIETPRPYTYRLYGTSISLWNPFTTEYKEIPKPPNYYGEFWPSLDPRINTSCLDDSFDEIAYGFGYDCKVEDYKIVKVVSEGIYLSGDTDEKLYYGCKVKVYTLGSNSWKHIPSVFTYSIVSNDGVFVNGAIHWIATQWNRGIKASDNVIVSFNFEDETLLDVSPVENFDDKLIITVGNLGGCLCVFGKPSPGHIEVWVMKDYGVRESWAKQFTINTCKSLGGYTSDYLEPIRSFSKGEILFSIRTRHDPSHNNLYQQALVLYDPKYESFRTLKISGGNWSVTKTYVGSLVSLNTGTYLGKKVKKKKKNMQLPGSRFGCLSEEES